MKEKIQNFFQNEKVKSLGRKVFNKRNFKVATAIIIVVVVLRIGFSLIFEVNGVVTKINGNNITVSNFFTTQTINTGDYPVDSNIIKVGDRIEITKNIQGQVLYIKDRNLNKSIGQNNHFNGRIGKDGSKRKH